MPNEVEVIGRVVVDWADFNPFKAQPLAAATIIIPDRDAPPVDLAIEFTRKLAIAYEHYRFVNQAQIATFNSRLKEQTLKRFAAHDAAKGNHHGGNNLYSKYDVLDFSDWDKYPGNPGTAVLDAAKTAQERGIFDVLEVAKVQSEVEYHDPILFGRIWGCGDRFIIAQWDNDIQVSDLIGPNEG